MKRKQTDTLVRQWVLLQRIPRYPRTATTRQLHEYLGREGYDVDIRTTQRDLERLSDRFPLSNDVEGRTHSWFWIREAGGMEIPGMAPSTALVMRLIKDYLTPLLPIEVLKQLEAYFKRADKVLQGTNLSPWLSKVCSITHGPILRPPEISKSIRDVVYEALLSDRCFKASYHSRTQGQMQKFIVNPLGLVVRQGVFYVVCTLWNYTDIRQLALHRITAARLQDTRCKHPVGFNLNHYVYTQAKFGYPRGDKPLKLQVLFDEGAACPLYEASLSGDQKLTKKKDGRVMLSATVPDTEELRWWLLGFGCNVEIVKPKSLREEVISTVMKMQKQYGSGSSD